MRACAACTAHAHICARAGPPAHLALVHGAAERREAHLGRRRRTSQHTDPTSHAPRITIAARAAFVLAEARSPPALAFVLAEARSPGGGAKRTHTHIHVCAKRAHTHIGLAEARSPPGATPGPEACGARRCLNRRRRETGPDPSRAVRTRPKGRTGQRRPRRGRTRGQGVRRRGTRRPGRARIPYR